MDTTKKDAKKPTVKKLELTKETVRDLRVRTNVKAGLQTGVCPGSVQQVVCQ
jgi:hypothetical protein